MINVAPIVHRWRLQNKFSVEKKNLRINILKQMNKIFLLNLKFVKIVQLFFFL
jgi:hypothetical protein